MVSGRNETAPRTDWRRRTRRRPMNRPSAGGATDPLRPDPGAGASLLPGRGRSPFCGAAAPWEDAVLRHEHAARAFLVTCTGPTRSWALERADEDFHPTNSITNPDDSSEPNLLAAKRQAARRPVQGAALSPGGPEVLPFPVTFSARHHRRQAPCAAARSHRWSRPGVRCTPWASD